MILFAPLVPLGILLLITGLIRLAHRRYQASLAPIAAGLLLIALFLWILRDWNQTLTRVNQQSQQPSPTHPATPTPPP
jgi:hypothetical protein